MKSKVQSKEGKDYQVDIIGQKFRTDDVVVTISSGSGRKRMIVGFVSRITPKGAYIEVNHRCNDGTVIKTEKYSPANTVILLKPEDAVMARLKGDL